MINRLVAAKDFAGAAEKEKETASTIVAIREKFESDREGIELMIKKYADAKTDKNEVNAKILTAIKQSLLTALLLATS